MKEKIKKHVIYLKLINTFFILTLNIFVLVSLSSIFSNCVFINLFLHLINDKKKHHINILPNEKTIYIGIRYCLYCYLLYALNFIDTKYLFLRSWI